ncbi:hypothetical protein DHW03_15200 [Pedobacter yonginense]|uniref:Cytochrome c domain-containing protein n=1 Tax=Pedobacter yonginense TaxID=651869 RepID=A0A317EH49_9SPHI|nr:hypothetical protein [Pedobacter yonginense]PWS26140.1 hypothetical protein DHW03_15200 [Pedobacter yonginense]
MNNYNIQNKNKQTLFFAGIQFQKKFNRAGLVLPRTVKTVLNILAVYIVILIFAAFSKKWIGAVGDSYMLPKLSDYHIYQGSMSILNPSSRFIPYQISSPLFSNYAEKQRLIFVPSGKKLSALNNGLPVFPDGTILVKTFYYASDEHQNKQIVETRLLHKINGVWRAGTYLWNKEQNEATLQSGGASTKIARMNKNGALLKFNYKLPSPSECGKCHGSEEGALPLGFKISNLNINIQNGELNQLTYLNRLNILNDLDQTKFSVFPNWRDSATPINLKARAYLDLNCAHCHSPNGYCAGAGLDFRFTTPDHLTGIKGKENRIIRMVENGDMPYIGAATVHQEGLDILKKYLSNIK